MYDEITALHYAAYRPKLHEILLAKCLLPDEGFQVGLDIGCGTGRSAVALTKYCDKVLAIDPSAEMLSKAESHSKISYIHMKDYLDIPNENFNIITFGGSLFYCKSQELYDRLITQCVPSALIIVYDFNIRLEEILRNLDLRIPQEINNYNHAEDFSRIRTDRLKTLCKSNESFHFPIEISDLTHFLLSHHSIYKDVRNKTETTDIFSYLTTKLAHLSKDITGSIPADLYYQKYRVV